MGAINNAVINLVEESEKEYFYSLPKEAINELIGDKIFNYLFAKYLEGEIDKSFIMSYLYTFATANFGFTTDTDKIVIKDFTELDSDIVDTIWDWADLIFRSLKYEYWVYRKLHAPRDVNETPRLKIKELKDEVGDNLLIIRRELT